MNALLQEILNACARSSAPDASPSKFLNERPSTTRVGGHGAGVAPVRPAASNAVDVMTLNVEPGGYPPASARGNPLSGLETTARIWPVLVSSATSAAGSVTALNAASAAACTCGSSVMITP